MRETTPLLSRGLPRFWILLLALSLASGSAFSQIVINEFMASNDRTIADENSDYSDWIELKNTTATPQSTEGWRLTDDPDDLGKWVMPARTIPANGYLLLFASSKNRLPPIGNLHANFNLSATGEYLALVKPDGTMASEFTPAYPEQQPDISYGLGADGTRIFFSPSTPGQPNGAGFFDFVEDTRFSHDRGFYETPFDLIITSGTPGATIRYTTNGTAPTLATGLAYAGPVRIAQTTVIRAAAFKDGLRPSNADTQTYLFLDDIIRQAANGQPPPGWPASWGSNVRDYGMDPEVVDNPLYSGTIKEDMKSIPSMSIVMNLNDLFSSGTGIYANPQQDGRAWERPTSLELIFPDGREGFQVNAGIRIRGGFSRSTSNPKHAFRFLFRGEYGDSKLIFPLFGDQGTDTFDALDLRTFQNYSWSFQGDSRGVFLRDQFSRDAQLAMGQNSTRGGFYHLYINGMYWGLYNTEERPEASYSATYFGGEPEDYDVIKVEAGPYTINATDGNMAAWNRLYTAARAGFASNESYFRIQGRNPDGSANPAYENLVDVPNLIDYMLVILYGGNLDAPISNFLGNTSPNNWYGVRNRNGTEGFRFIVHDSEHTLLNVSEDRTGPYPAGDSDVTKSNPQWIWQKMQANPEFKMLAADHIHRHFFNGGVLTPQSAAALFTARRDEIDRAVVGESARWGDSKRSRPFTRNIEWVSAINTVLNSFIPNRSSVVLNQLRADGLYPAVAAPAFSQHGGNVPRNFNVSISSAGAATVYYTLDGTDPRLIGGNVSPAASVYAGQPVSIAETTRIRSRARANGVWSAMNEATFTVIQTFKDLLITEIMYNAESTNGISGDDLEFLELKNVSSVEQDLSGVHFTAGIDYVFPLGQKLAPGRHVVLVSNPAEFAKVYPGVTIDGVYTNSLANGGERLALGHAAGGEIFSVTYDDASPWPTTPDGDGFSLVTLNPNANPAPNSASNWRASSRLRGSPGADDPPLAPGFVVINELLTHTSPPQQDTIELYNPSSIAVNIGGWFLTDDRANPKKFGIPAGTVLAPGAYAVFTEAQFGASPATGFRLDSHGEQILIYSADAAGNLTGYSDGATVGGSANGVSFGRHTNSVGAVSFPAQIAVTLGAVNSGPRAGPVVLNEIRYHPQPGEEEFVEIRNISGAAVKLYDPNFPTNTWQINGLGFAFPPNVELPPDGLAIVVGADPVQFRQRYGVPQTVPVFGPPTGSLQDGGERLQLLRPDEPDTASDGSVIVPYIVVDEVAYDDDAPWPASPAGFGPSLERTNPLAYADDPASWRESAGPASPGLPNDGNRPPIVSAGPDAQFQSGAFPFAVSLQGAVRDDGLPNPPRRVSAQWSQVSGPGVAVFASPESTNTTAQLPGAGTYVLRLTATDGELTTQDEVILAVQRPAAAFVAINAGAVWKYLDNGSDQGTAWRAPSFNDSAWRSGPAKLGYGDGGEATVIGFGPSSQSKYVTTYFRHAFDVPSAGAVAGLTLDVLRDDGAVVYLNGTEVFRSNMPEGDIHYLTWASEVAEDNIFYTGQVTPSLLVNGRNVIAVEVHQVNAASSDLGFDLRLSGLRSPSNQPPVAQAGPDVTGDAGADLPLSGIAQDDGLPEVPGFLAITWSKISGPGGVEFANPNAAATTVRISEAGAYVLRLTAADGQATATDDVQVTVRGADGFEAWRQQFFTPAELANAAISGEAADPDLDGHTNREEFITGTNPKNEQSVLRIEEVESLSADARRLRFESVAGRSYSIQYADSLVGEVWQKLADVASSPLSGTVEVDDTNASAPARYYRLVTPQQP